MRSAVILLSAYRGILALSAICGCLAFPDVAHAQPADSLVSGLHGGTQNDGDLLDHRMSGEWRAVDLDLADRRDENQAKKCFEMGCIFFVNETHGYDVIGMYFNTARRDVGASPKWSPNQFPRRLGPRRVAWTYKAGDATMCDLPVRVELRKRGGKDRVTVSGTVSLCSSPARDTLFRINVVEPRVTLDEPEK